MNRIIWMRWRRVLFWGIFAFIALGIIQPNVGTGLTSGDPIDLLNVMEPDEFNQKCGGGPKFRELCPQVYQAYCTYFAPFHNILSLFIGRGFIFAKAPALSKSRWAPRGSIVIDYIAQPSMEEISTGFYAAYATWPTRQQALDDIAIPCPYTLHKYKRLYRPFRAFPDGHHYFIPSRKLGFTLVDTITNKL